jgi:hypothetical protein
LGANFFSRVTSGRTRDARGQLGAPEIPLEVSDRQQVLVLDALRRAAGAPVSYAELRDAGVELPASVVSELELAGVAIERCHRDSGGAVGVRLDPANDPAAQRAPDPPQPPVPTDAVREPAWSGHPVHHAASPMLVPASHKSRVLVLTAVLAALAVLSPVVAMWASGGDRGTRVPIARRPPARAVVATGGARPVGKPRSAHLSRPVPVSPALAAELEAQGHSMVEDGRYGDAVPVLKRAVLATGETLDACLEPGSSTCLTYAYALYDLGRAVRLSGNPQAAVPILERRLQIDNQRWVVVAELQLARQGVG